jgi:hypothetical protein
MLVVVLGVLFEDWGVDGMVYRSTRVEMFERFYQK